jgi:hypothetical protein
MTLLALRGSRCLEMILHSSSFFRRSERILDAIFSGEARKSRKCCLPLNSMSRITSKVHLSPNISSAQLTGQEERLFWSLIMLTLCLIFPIRFVYYTFNMQPNTRIETLSGDCQYNFFPRNSFISHRDQIARYSLSSEGYAFLDGRYETERQRQANTNQEE